MASQVDKIVECLKNVNLDEETRDKALNNLVVVARDQGGGVLFERPECLEIIKRNSSPKSPIPSRVASLRLLSEICKSNEERTRKLLSDNLFPIEKLVDIVEDARDDEILTSFQYLIQTILNSLSFASAGSEKALAKPIDESRTKTVAESLATLQKPSKIDKSTVERNHDLLLSIFLHLIQRSSSVLLSAAARDCLLALILTNIDPVSGLNFGQQLTKRAALERLLNIASEVDELKHESSMETSVSTHSLVSACLEKIYLCHDSDKSREEYLKIVQNYVDIKLKSPEFDDKVRIVKVFSTLLAGPTEIGNSCVGQNGMIEMMLAMANSDDLGPQKAALDAIIAASSKKDKCNAFAKMGEKILMRLRESSNDEIKFRALVGLAKISSVAGTDASIRPFDRKENIELARECRRVLARPTPEFNLKKWCAEALAYLSFDGDVKQELVEDGPALQALYDLAVHFAGHTEANTLSEQGRGTGQGNTVIFAALATMVNLTNAYDKQEQIPELLELAKFAKQHIPQEHPMDSRPAVEARLQSLVKAGVVAALVKLANELISANCATQHAREMIARILNALCELDKLRGIIVQQGGGTLLLTLASTTAPSQSVSTSSVAKAPKGYEELITQIGGIQAAQALARLSITLNPELAFPGQKLLGLVKPLRRLLDTKCTALQNFEALMALTNLAQVSNEAVREQIIRDQGYHQIESYMYEEHKMLRRAAVQCVANLIRDERIVKLYELDDSDRVKYLMVLCQDDDQQTVSAASGALAMLCQISSKSCEKIFSAKDWNEILINLLSAGENDFGLVHRALVVVNSVVKTRKMDLVTKIFETQIFEILMALSLDTDEQIAPEHIKSLAGECLEIGRELKVIKAPTAP